MAKGKKTQGSGLVGVGGTWRHKKVSPLVGLKANCEAAHTAMVKARKVWMINEKNERRDTKRYGFGFGATDTCQRSYLKYQEAFRVFENKRTAYIDMLRGFEIEHNARRERP